MWKVPDPGDIVWCLYPEQRQDVPGEKPRPVLVIAVKAGPNGALVTVAYGTSQRVNQLFAGEFAIRRADNLTAYKLAGLSYDTKFDLSDRFELPWSDVFFAVPPRAPYGQTPKLGALHMPSLGQALRAAATAAGLL